MGARWRPATGRVAGGVGVEPGGAPATGAHQLTGGKAGGGLPPWWTENRERERVWERETVRERRKREIERGERIEREGEWVLREF